LSGTDAANPPGTIAEKKNIAGQAFDGKIFIHGADEGLTGKFDDSVVGRVRNRSAVGDRSQPRAAPGAQHAVNAVAMQIRAAAAAPGLDAFAEHFQDLIEILARQIPVGVCRADQVPQSFFTDSTLFPSATCSSAAFLARVAGEDEGGRICSRTAAPRRTC
jgi:hypothetical protein